MKLSELFNYLTYGELANLKVGGKDEGCIHPTYSNEVVSYIKQGLTDLHTRFPLKQGECVVRLRDEVTMYHLTSDHAISNTESTEYYKYIDDVGQYPFEDDIIRIDRVYNEIGQELLVNSEHPDCTIFIPQYNTIQVINPLDENAIGVLYTADHNPIDLKKDDPSKIDIDIPSTLVNALCLYVAYLAHSAVGTQEALATGFSKLQQYEATCMQAEFKNIVRKTEFINNRHRVNGWV